MRPSLRTQRTDAKRRRRPAVVLALGMAAFGGGLIVPGGAAGQANCTLPNTPTNDSCVKLVVSPNNPGSAFKNSQLFVRMRTAYTNPANKAQGGFWKTVTLLFDNDFRFTPGPIPKCSPAALAGKNIAQAWERCGPGADTPPEVNAYLSPPTAVSGTFSTVGSSPGLGNFAGCTLVFNGFADANANPTVTLFLRITSGNNQSANCASPATNTAGPFGSASTAVLTGTITNAGVAGFGKKLTVPNFDQLGMPLDDLYATLRRHISATSSYFQARCPAGASPWRLRGIFAYSGGPPSPEPTDTVNSTQPCS
jgi:hypothetical protein